MATQDTTTLAFHRIEVIEGPDFVTGPTSLRNPRNSEPTTMPEQKDSMP
jgi:hypothetical protein